MLINHPGSYQQMADIAIDAGIARDITLMLTDAHAVIDGLTARSAPAAAREAAAILAGTGSPYTIQSLACALAETINRLCQARDDALAGCPDHIPGSGQVLAAAAPGTPFHFTADQKRRETEQRR